MCFLHAGSRQAIEAEIAGEDNGRDPVCHSHVWSAPFRFQDEILVSDNRYSRGLFELLIESGISNKIRWSGQTRVNLVTDDIIGLAKKAGCYLLGMGIESGDDETLKRIHKGFTVEQVREAVRIIKKHRIRLGTYFIIGHPYETRLTAQEDYRLGGRAQHGQHCGWLDGALPWYGDL